MANFVNSGFETDLSSWNAGKPPADIGSVWAIHDASIIAGSDGDAIGTFSDTGGSSRHLTQSTSTQKPLKKTAIQNGLDILRFDSTDVMYETSSSALNGDKTQAIVAKTTNTGGYKTMTGFGTDGGGYHIFSFDPSEQLWLNTAGVPDQLTDGNANTSNFEIYLAYNSGTTFYISINGGTESSKAMTSSNEEAGHIIGDYISSGASQPALIDCGEWDIFSANLSAQNKSYFLSYLAKKWGITLGSTYGANVTRDTGTKYAGSASAKIVTAAANSLTPFYEVINPGTTASCTITGYAYTTGSAVTSSDVELYYDGAAVTTTFTDMGSGWYKMTATVTGAAADKKVGVEVKTNKTVYVDSFDLSTTAIKKVAGVSYSSLKKVSGVAIASVKKAGGIA